MKYNININQLVLSETELDLKDCAILDYLIFLCNSKNKKIEKQRVEGYTWVNYQNLINDMPLLKINSTNSMTPRINKIKRSGFIKTKIIRKNGHKHLLVKLTELIDSLIVEIQKPNRETLKPNRETVVNNNTKDNNTKDNTIPLTADANIKEFKKYKEDNQRHIQLIGRYYLLKVKMKQLQPFPTLKALRKDFGRQLKPASELSDYDDDRIKEAIDKAHNSTNEWTLLTVCKFINKN